MKIIQNNFIKNRDKFSSKLTIEEFWFWFRKNSAKFLNVIKKRRDVDVLFIDPLFNKINSVKEGVYLSAGMRDNEKAELIFTTDGKIKMFPIVEDIVSKAPRMNNWIFTAHKQATNLASFGIKMGAKSFTCENIKFYSNRDENYPDKISINIVFLDEYVLEEVELVKRGCFIFIENYLGELCTHTKIDELSFKTDLDSPIILIDVSKLKDYIDWREKEFIEQYEKTFYNSENSNYKSLEWKNHPYPIIGVCNSDLLNWPAKVSHPWIVVICIEFKKENNNGMPSPELLQSIYQFEDELRSKLKDINGYLHVGQTTGQGERNVYFACKNFRTPVLVLNSYQNKTSFSFNFDVFKDKYWTSMSLFE